MIVVGSLGMFAAAALQTPTPSTAALGISATVVRPVEISPLSITSDDDLLIIRNAGDVIVGAEGGSVSRSADDATWLVAANDETAVVTITLTF